MTTTGRSPRRPDRHARLLGAAALLALALGGCAPDDGSSVAQAGAPVVLPASVANDWKGKVVVADFWATWCPPCRASSPRVQALHDAFAGDDKVLVVGVHSDDSVGDEAPGKYMLEHGYSYALVAPGGEVARAFQIEAFPTFVILDERGREVFRSVGLLDDATRKTIEKKVRALRG